jgi:hypothetical protein
METRRWINQAQPQTLVIATFLLYFNAFFTLLLQSERNVYVLAALIKVGVGYSNLLEQLVRLGLGIGAAAGAYLIANEKRWGYRLAVAVAAAPLLGVLILLLLPTMNDIARLSLEDLDLVSLLFSGALFALLLHPQSRDYERIWFK